MNLKIISKISGFLVLFIIAYSFSKKGDMKKAAVYNVPRLKQAIKIDGNWDKPQWKNVKEIPIDNYMGAMPAFHPSARAKMMYADENLYVIFRVQDRYIRCVTQNFNGPVSTDACVEFFFSPDTSSPDSYFNFEINCGGTALMGYHTIPHKNCKTVEVDDIKQIKIAHSLPELIDAEITEPVTWTIEYRIPLALLEKYANITRPKAGVTWKANFYKTASNSSNPHWITWSFVDNPTPNFHLPDFFGTLKFK